MPKIIKDLHPKILEAAQELFTQSAYMQVDTRKISNAVGIAAGTLYNYFPTKKDLFFAVFEKSWTDSLVRLEDAVRNLSDDADAIDVFLKALDAEFSRNKRLGKSFFQLTVSERIKRDDRHSEVRTGHLPEIAGKMCAIFVQAITRYAGQPLPPRHDEDLQRMVLLLHVAFPFMDSVYGDRPDENIRFLSHMMHAYINMISEIPQNNRQK